MSELSERSVGLFDQAILNCVKQEGLDGFSTVIIDSTGIKADSAWPVDSLLLKNLARKLMKNIQAVYSGFSSLQSLLNYCNDMGKLDFEISMVKGRKKCS